MAKGFDYIKTLYDDMLSMVSNLVVKRIDLAKKYESSYTYRSFDCYRVCTTGTPTFYNFDKFDRDILRRYLTVEQTVEALKNPNTIPEEVREDLIRDQMKRVLSTYEERNDYYRMLMGLPPIDEHIFIFVQDHEDIIDPHTPIHKLSDEQIAQLEMDGTIARLKKKYPNAEYLNYLGANKIDFMFARSAKPFEILRLGPPSSNRTRKMFESEYYKARRYVMSIANHPEYFPNREMFYPILGLLIVTLAIRNTLVPNEADYLNFDEILDEILESYGFKKYFERFPFTFKQRLVLALNKIVANKGTDGVLIDICELFNFDNFSANRYYLLKTRAKDIDGHIIESDDPNEMYDLQFVKADIREYEMDMNAENLISYSEVTDNDYLWQLTDEDKTELLKRDFNLMMTKYIDIEAAYDVTALTFEVCGFVNLVLRSKENISHLRVTNHYSSTGYSSVWLTLVFLLAALAKRSGYDGNIVYNPEDVFSVWEHVNGEELVRDHFQFNYRDLSGILAEIYELYEGQIDVSDTLVPGYSALDLQKPSGRKDALDEIKIFAKNRDLYEAILKEMATTDDDRRYAALARARDALFFTTTEEASFEMSTGDPAPTYYDMLRDADPSMAAKLDALDPEEDLDALNNMILYILEKLEDVFSSPELNYLFMNTPNAYRGLISNYLRTAINVFKAATVQLESINIFLYMGNQEPVRAIDRKYTEREIYLNHTVHVDDEVATQKTIYLEDYVGCIDKAYTNL